MTEVSPTRSAVLELKDERRAMHEGYVFLDEKCLLLAAEMLRELRRYDALQAAFLRAHEAALAALQAAIARHGLDGLQVEPARAGEADRIRRTSRSLMGVKLQDAGLDPDAGDAAGALPAGSSPESRACRETFAKLLLQAAPLAAATGNLERLHAEYRRSVRRARALQDVLLPELDRTVRELDTRLEELEQEDAIWMRTGSASAR